jgi:hypothetical protein
LGFYRRHSSLSFAPEGALLTALGQRDKTIKRYLANIFEKRQVTRPTQIVPCSSSTIPISSIHSAVFEYRSKTFMDTARY